MSKVLYYKQCKLEKGDRATTSWIPEKHAVRGRILKLKENDQWDDDWLVKEVYPQKMEAKLVENQAHDSGDIWKATSGKYPRGNK